MATEKLYYSNSYLVDFCATVLTCLEYKKGYMIVLDKTAFYPEGGGQPFDTGYLLFEGDKLEIFEVQEKQGEVYHYSKLPLPVGATVQGFIDFDRRFDLMQQHTGEHILSGLVKSLFGFENVGFHLSDKDMSVDFSGVLSSDDIEALVINANKIILENQPVTASFPLGLDRLDYRCKKELAGEIRIVEAGKADTCACCGTHTNTTGEVICVAVLSSVNHKGGSRLFIVCGGRVLADYMAKNDQCYKISSLLSSKIFELVPSLEAKLAEAECLKQELSRIKNQLFALWVDGVPSGKLGFFEKEDLSAGEAQRLAQLLNEKCEIAVISSPQKDASCKICIISSVADTNFIGNSICERLHGKGGGKKGIFQCTVQQSGIKSLLENLLCE